LNVGSSLGWGKGGAGVLAKRYDFRDPAGKLRTALGKALALKIRDLPG